MKASLELAHYSTLSVDDLINSLHDHAQRSEVEGAKQLQKSSFRRFLLEASALPDTAPRLPVASWLLSSLRL